VCPALARAGLYAEEERGGGGGLDNAGLVELLSSVPADVDLDKVAKTLAEAAVALGSTDDVTVVVLRLQAA
jgi:protein phosphatase 1L